MAKRPVRHCDGACIVRASEDLSHHGHQIKRRSVAARRVACAVCVTDESARSAVGDDAHVAAAAAAATSAFSDDL